MTIISDGKGSGKSASVNSDNELVVTPLSKTPMEYATGKGDAYSWNVDEYSATANETIIAVQNNNSELLYIDRLTVSSASPASFTIYRPSAVTSLGGTDITAVNLQFGHSNTASGVLSAYNATATQSTVITNIEIGSNGSMTVDLRGIAIKDGETIAVDIEDSVTASATIYGYFIN